MLRIQCNLGGWEVIFENRFCYRDGREVNFENHFCYRDGRESQCYRGGATERSILKITKVTGMTGKVNFENHFCSRDVWNVNLKITCAIGTVENIDVFLLAVNIFFGESSVGWENKCNRDGPGGRPTKKPAKLEQGS